MRFPKGPSAPGRFSLAAANQRAKRNDEASFPDNYRVNRQDGHADLGTDARWTRSAQVQQVCVPATSHSKRNRQTKRTFSARDEQISSEEGNARSSDLRQLGFEDCGELIQDTAMPQWIKTAFDTKRQRLTSLCHTSPRSGESAREGRGSRKRTLDNQLPFDTLGSATKSPLFLGQLPSPTLPTWQRNTRNTPTVARTSSYFRDASPMAAFSHIRPATPLPYLDLPSTPCPKPHVSTLHSSRIQFFHRPGNVSESRISGDLSPALFKTPGPHYDRGHSHHRASSETYTPDNLGMPYSRPFHQETPTRNFGRRIPLLDFQPLMSPIFEQSESGELFPEPLLTTSPNSLAIERTSRDHASVSLPNSPANIQVEEMSLTEQRASRYSVSEARESTNVTLGSLAAPRVGPTIDIEALEAAALSHVSSAHHFRIYEDVPWIDEPLSKVRTSPSVKQDINHDTHTIQISHTRPSSGQSEQSKHNARKLERPGPWPKLLRRCSNLSPAKPPKLSTERVSGIVDRQLEKASGKKQMVVTVESERDELEAVQPRSKDLGSMDRQKAPPLLVSDETSNAEEGFAVLDSPNDHQGGDDYGAFGMRQGSREMNEPSADTESRSKTRGILVVIAPENDLEPDLGHDRNDDWFSTDTSFSSHTSDAGHPGFEIWKD